MTAADLGDMRIEYEVRGPDAGPSMLLLMGLGTQLVAWPPELLEALTAAGFRVVLMDNRDVGLSSKTPGRVPSERDVLRSFAHRRLARADYLVSDMAADAVRLLDHLGVGRVHVVGASMGGMIAQQLTIDHPDRVSSLTSIMSNTGDRRHGLISPSLLPALLWQMRAGPPSTRAEAVELGVAAFVRIAGEHVERSEVAAMVESALARDPGGAGTTRQLLAVNASPDRTPGLRRVRAPTLVVHGLADRLVRPSGGVATARAVPGSRLLMFPDMGHDLPRPRRGEIATAIVDNAARA